jgi:hypothetical protein
MSFELTHISAASSVADPDPGSGAFLTPGSGFRDGKKFQILIRDYFLKVKLLKFFDVDPDPVSGIFSTRDGKIRIRIRNTGCKISVSTLYLHV